MNFIFFALKRRKLKGSFRGLKEGLKRFEGELFKDNFFVFYLRGEELEGERGF